MVGFSARIGERPEANFGEDIVSPEDAGQRDFAKQLEMHQPKGSLGIPLGQRVPQDSPTSPVLYASPSANRRPAPRHENYSATQFDEDPARPVHQSSRARSFTSASAASASHGPGAQQPRFVPPDFSSPSTHPFPPRVPSPLSREYLGRQTFGKLANASIKELTDEVNKNRKQYAFGGPHNSTKRIGDYVSSVRRTIESLRGRVPFDEDEPIENIFERYNISTEEILQGHAYLRPPRDGSSDLQNAPGLKPWMVDVRYGLEPWKKDSRYGSPSTLPGPSAENPTEGTRNYGSVKVHGGAGAIAAYQGMRKAVARDPRQVMSQNVVRKMENSLDPVNVHPFKVRHDMGKSSPDAMVSMHIDRQGRRWSELRFGYNQGLIAGNGARVGPDSVFVHESQHIVDARLLDDLAKEPLGNYSNKGELRAIVVEGELAEMKDQYERDSHWDTVPYQTAGPNDNRAANLLVEQTLHHVIPNLQRLNSRMDSLGIDQSRPPHQPRGQVQAEVGSWLDQASRLQEQRIYMLQALDDDVALFEGREPRYGREHGS